MNLDTLNELLSGLDKLQGLPGAALVFLSCLVVGYTLKFWRRFPNDGIPVAVVMWGGLAMLFIADPRPTNLPARIWTARNLLVGLIIGAGSWVLHHYLLYKIEDWIAKVLPGASDTAFFRNKTANADKTTKGTDDDKTKT